MQVVGRVLGTIVGACLGLGINHIPGIDSSPLLLLVCLGLACIPLSMIARAQARNSVALAILTLLSVSLCLFETTCYVPGTHLAVLDVFLIRMGAVSAPVNNVGDLALYGSLCETSPGCVLGVKYAQGCNQYEPVADCAIMIINFLCHPLLEVWAQGSCRGVTSQKQ